MLEVRSDAVNFGSVVVTRFYETPLLEYGYTVVTANASAITAGTNVAQKL